jgi:hypothetical protein
MDDELNLDRAIDVPVYQDVLAWEGVWAGRFELASVFSCPTSQIPFGVCAAEADVDCLPMAKPVAINHLRIRRDCAIVFGLWLVVGSSLQEPPSLLLDCDRGKRVRNLWDRGIRCFGRWLMVVLVLSGKGTLGYGWIDTILLMKLPVPKACAVLALS